MGNGCSCSRVQVNIRENSNITFDAVTDKFDLPPFLAHEVHITGTTNFSMTPHEICQVFPNIAENSTSPHEIPLETPYPGGYVINL